MMAKPGDPSQGKPAEDEQIEQEAAATKEAAATEAAADASAEPEAAPKKPRRKTPAKKAEATAAEQTGVGKDEAEAALAGAGVEPAEEVPADTPVEEQSRSRRTRSRARKSDEPAEQAKPARRPAPSTNGRPVVKANAKYVRTSARKARLVCDHIRGKSVAEARAILAHTPRAVAEDWSKLLESAVANAEHNHELLGDDLRILSVTADEGPTLKRFRPRAMGRATRIRKRTAHLSIALTPKEQ
jgi:ribosomal protein L22